MGEHSMPGYMTHIAAGGLVTGGALYVAQVTDTFQAEPVTYAALVAIGMLAGLFPDVDTDSRGQRLYYALLLIVDLGLMIHEEYRWAAILGFLAMIPAIDNHRGWTHTWWAMLVVPLPILALPMTFYDYGWEPLLPFYLAAVLGYCSHLLLDNIT